MKKEIITILLTAFSYMSLVAQPINDSKTNAIEIDHQLSWTSADEAYTNVGSTADGTPSDCISNAKNVWFKFQATTTDIDVRVLNGGSKGTLQNPAVVLFTDAGSVLGCYASPSNTFLQRTNLIVGAWYYLAVDSQYGQQGTFTLSVKNVISYDLKEKALVLEHSPSWTSADAAYTNVGSTPDGTGSGCINVARNVWFKFQATSTDIDVRVFTGSSKGTLNNPAVVLYTDAGSELGCHANPSNAFLQRANLTIGAWYYLVVDSQYGQEGTFTLSVKNVVSHDLKEKALVLEHSPSWTSADAAYTNVGSTPDGPGGGCINNASNVWFKFQATTTDIDVRVLVGGVKGTLPNPAVVLFTEAGSLLGCYVSPSNTFLQRTNLVVGAWYYLAIDSQYGQQGTFTLSVKNTISNDLKTRATVIEHATSWTSADAAYTNVDSTPDGPGGGCFNNAKNVWFKFQAITDEIEVRIKVGGAKGTLVVPAAVLFTETGTVLGCTGNESEVILKRTDLVIGSWYYLAVDGFYGHQGTFTLSIKNSFGNDNKAKAQIIPHEGAWCSGDALFTNAEATADETNSSTCGTSFNKNVWFKFQATSTNATVKLKTGSTLGTLTNGSSFLISETGTMLTCQTGTGADEVHLTSTSLMKGQWYYLVVDNLTGTSGTFSLCLEGGAEASALCDNIYCDEQGGVGVGTSIVPAGYRMAVAGKIIAEGVKVELQTKWPDYVFDPSYKLMPLTELRDYVNEYRHLPNIPAASIVEEGGVDLAEMNAALLQKVEEMTLYIIKLEERLKKLEQLTTGSANCAGVAKRKKK